MALFGGRGNRLTGTIGKMAGLLLSFYVFNEVVTTIYVWQQNGGIDLANNSSVFYTTAIFVDTLLPITGILASFEIIYQALRQSGLA